MRLKVEIDSRSGFCNGVIRAVKEAEENLEKRRPLYSLGAIVHNNSELQRLQGQGLEIIDMERMRNMNGGTVLIRAHGEPPSTYLLARERGITLIDCTCPVVLKLQEKIRNTYREILQSGNGGQIVMFGKENHAEVNGLVGQVESNAVVADILPGGKIKGLEKIDFSRPVYIFSQTTKDPQEYESVCSAIRMWWWDFAIMPIAARAFADGHVLNVWCCKRCMRVLCCAESQLGQTEATWPSDVALF